MANVIVLSVYNIPVYVYIINICSRYLLTCFDAYWHRELILFSCTLFIRNDSNNNEAVLLIERNNGFARKRCFIRRTHNSVGSGV